MVPVVEQAGPCWIKARRSASVGACVELAVDREFVLIRDSKQPRTFLRYTRLEIEAFLDGAKRGEFDHLLGGR